MHLGKKSRFCHPTLHFPTNLFHISSFIIPPLTAPSHLLSAFHVNPSPSALLTPSFVCLGVFLSLPFSYPYLSSSFTLSPALPSNSISSCWVVLLLSVSYLQFTRLVSIVSLGLVTHHKNCSRTLNSPGVPQEVSEAVNELVSVHTGALHMLVSWGRCM